MGRSTVIPAKAGIQADSEPATAALWIPAFAGMTGCGAEMTECSSGSTSW
jgi:hypothetical protein